VNSVQISTKGGVESQYFPNPKQSEFARVNMETSLANRLHHSNLSNSLGSSGFRQSNKFEYDEVITEIKDSINEDVVKPGLSKSESDRFRDQLIQELHEMEEEKSYQKEDLQKDQYSETNKKEGIKEEVSQNESEFRETRLKANNDKPKQIEEEGKKSL